MSNRTRWAARLQLRAKELTALEEKVLRMRYGLQTSTLLPLPRAGQRNAQAAEQLAQMEAHLVRQLQGAAKPRRR